MIAEGCSGWGLIAAGRADPGQRTPASGTKSRPFTISLLAVWATHGSPPQNSGERSRGAPGPEPRRAFLIYKGWVVCQYSRPSPVSSEKHETTSDAGVDGGDGGTWWVRTATVVMGNYHPLPEPLAVISRMAKSATALRVMTLARWYVDDAVLERLAQPVEDGPSARRRASRQSTPWCASDTSPGSGTWPPPIRPTSESV